MAVLLNGLTTIAGFGSLMVASHQGIFSLGLLLTLGISANLLSALLVLPPLLALFYPKGVGLRGATPPVSPASASRGRDSPPPR